MLAKDSMFRQT